MMLMSYESMTGNIVWLVTGTMEFSMTSHHIGNFIIPTDVLIFFRGVGIPPTCSIIGYLMIFDDIFHDMGFWGLRFLDKPMWRKALTFSG